MGHRPQDAVRLMKAPPDLRQVAAPKVLVSNLALIRSLLIITDCMRLFDGRGVVLHRCRGSDSILLKCKHTDARARGETWRVRLFPRVFPL